MIQIFHIGNLLNLLLLGLDIHGQKDGGSHGGPEGGGQRTAVHHPGGAAVLQQVRRRPD